MNKRKPTVCSNIKFAWHAIARLYNEQGSKYGVTTSVGFVLLNIDKEDGVPATKIAPMLGMEAHGLSRILKNTWRKTISFIENKTTKTNGW